MAALQTPGFGWSTPSASKVVLHPESFLVDCANFPSNAPGELLNKALESQAVVPADLAVSILNAMHAYFDNSTEFTEELDEFLSTGCSNGRPLKWHFMHIAPNTSFRLHAHQNIELIYVARGTMHELRLNGAPIKRLFPVDEKDGPSLLDLDHEVKFMHRSTTAASPAVQDRFLVNEKGSIHLSYTMEDGADLLVLWSGSHGNIPAELYPHNASESLALPPNVTPY